MDNDFFEDLEKALTGTGATACWRRRVGDIELWISPLTLTGQNKVMETVANASSNTAVNEIKRITLSNAIVGINEMDLRPFRDGNPVFPSLDRERKPIKISLDKYLYNKLASWGSQFIDDVYAVFADLMESYQKQNLKDVKFENTKDPREELAELMVKVTELREQLGKSQLVDPDEEPVLPFPDDEPKPEEEIFQGKTDFDPFQAVPPAPRRIINSDEPRPEPTLAPDHEQLLKDIEAEAAAQSQIMKPALTPMPTTGPIPAPVLNSPVVTRPNINGPVHVATPSVPSEVMEQPASRVPVPSIEIDKPSANRNPRFSPPQR